MMLRASSPVIQTPKLGNLRREAYPFTRTRICYPRQLCFCQSETTESGVDESLQIRTGTPSLFIAEKEEAKAILTLFLKTQGLSSSFKTKTVHMSDQFIEHLVSKLHSVHKTRYLIGRELSTLEIRDTLTPYLESLLKEHGDILVGVVENFPNTPAKETPKLASPTSLVVENFPNAPAKETPKLASPTSLSPSLKKLKAVARVSEIGDDGQLPLHILYLLELGMDLDQIKSITHRFPAFAYYSLEGKIKPVVEFLLDLGVNQSDIPTILCKRPQLCGISMSENLIPMMAYLESLGVDKKKWAKVIYRFPALLTCSRQKVKATVDFFYELGLTAESVGKILTRYPSIVGCSVEENLRPTAEYFSSLGVDAAVLVYRAPQVFGLSIEGNLKPLTEFFLEKGYTTEEVGTMVSRYGTLFSYSLLANVKPKWEFFLTMDYPMSELVKFPQYFGYSLEERIKPRYAMMRESGVKMYLNQVLTVAEPVFEATLRRRVKKKLGLVGSNIGLSLNIPNVQIETTL